MIARRFPICKTVRDVVMKRRLLLLIMAVVSSQLVFSQSIKDFWLDMPDSLFPYLNRSLREDCLTLKSKGLNPETNNLLKEKTAIDTCANDYMAARMSKSASLQMRLLPYSKGDSVVCVVVSYRLPEADSSVSLYTRDWNKISEISFGIEQLVSRPDTMGADEYEKLLKLLDPYLVSASLSTSDASLEVCASAASVAEEERGKLETILKKRKYVWTGEAFSAE